MVKVQVIKRKAGNKAYLIYIPLSEVELAQIEKGDEMLVQAEGIGRLTITKQ